MKVLLIDNGTKHLGRLKTLLLKHEVTICNFFSVYSDSDLFDLIILSGGSQLSISSAPEIFKGEVELIKTTKVPVIGICQGCEIIAHAFGGQLEFVTHKTKGLKKVKIINPDLIFSGKDFFEVYEAHPLFYYSSG